MTLTCLTQNDYFERGASSLVSRAISSLGLVIQYYSLLILRKGLSHGKRSGTFCSLSQFYVSPCSRADAPAKGVPALLIITEEFMFLPHRPVLPLGPSSNAPLFPTELLLLLVMIGALAVSLNHQWQSNKHNCLAAQRLRLFRAKASWCAESVDESLLL